VQDDGALVLPLLVTRGDDAGEGSSWLHPCLRPPSGAPPHELRWSVIGERDGFAAKLPREEGKEGWEARTRRKGRGQPLPRRERERGIRCLRWEGWEEGGRRRLMRGVHNLGSIAKNIL
jgi:hypothetical protein